MAYKSCLQKYESILYWSLVAIDVIFPVCFLFVFLAEHHGTFESDGTFVPNKQLRHQMRAFYGCWIVTLCVSVYFLLSAFFKINRNIVEVARGQINKSQIGWQIVGQILFLIAVLIPGVTTFDDQEDSLKVLIVAVFLQFFTIMIEMYQWQRIIWVALGLQNAESEVYAHSQGSYSGNSRHSINEPEFVTKLIISDE